MKHEYQNGKIILHGFWWESAPFNTANEQISVQFDGKGGLGEYMSVYHSGNFIASPARLVFAINGVTLDAFTPKTIEMIGRMQTITLQADGIKIVLEQFIVPEQNGVFLKATFATNSFSECEVSFYSGYPIAGAKVLLKGKAISANEMIFVSSVEGEWIEDNNTFYIKREIENSDTFYTYLSFGGTLWEAEEAINNFHRFYVQALGETQEINYPATIATEEEKACYCNMYFCVLQNYRRMQKFAAFSAGCRYIYPLRTYFRDGYWTTLVMYPNHVDLVKNHIITLAHGISSDGSCPSAVLYDFSAFWGDHYDSPSFFVMALYDYVNHTGDTSLLSLLIKDETVLNIAVKVLNRLTEYADDTGLIYKEGPYNKRDWADEVNRNGYVAYDEILYIRALFCLYKLLRAVGEAERAEQYFNLCEQAKTSFYKILWNEEKGYFNNYQYGDFTETNFSADILTAVIFEVCTKEQAERILQNAEKYLDTRYNKLQKAGNFGIMSVYPFYRGLRSTFRKSSQPYNYHNGASWPYLSAIYAYAQSLYKKEWKYALTSWFDYNVQRGNYTPIEYYSPCCNDGSLLQAWSGFGAFVFRYAGKPSFFKPNKI